VPEIKKGDIAHCLRFVVANPPDGLVTSMHELFELRATYLFAPPLRLTDHQAAVERIQQVARELRGLIQSLPSPRDFLDSVLIAYQLKGTTGPLEETTTDRRDLKVWLAALAEANAAFVERKPSAGYQGAIREAAALLEAAGLPVTIHENAGFVKFLCELDTLCPGLVFPRATSPLPSARARYVGNAVKAPNSPSDGGVIREIPLPDD
jgi:hypothetical protein